MCEMHLFILIVLYLKISDKWANLFVVVMQQIKRCIYKSFKLSFVLKKINII